MCGEQEQVNDEAENFDFEEFLSSIFAVPTLPEDLVAHYNDLVVNDDEFFSTPESEKLDLITSVENDVRDVQAALREEDDDVADWRYVSEQLVQNLALVTAALKRYVLEATPTTV